MEDHAHVSQQRVEPLAVGGRRGERDEGVAGTGQQHQEKALERQEKEPEEHPGGRLQGLVAGGAGKDRPGQGQDQAPEQQGTGLPGPESGDRIKKRQQAVGIIRDIGQGKVPGEQAAQKRGRGAGHQERGRVLAALQPGEFAPLSAPGFQAGQGPAQKRDEHGQEQGEVRCQIHHASKVT